MESFFKNKELSEDGIAAIVISGLLTDAFLHPEGRKDKYRAELSGWERDGLKWLLRFLHRNPKGYMSSDWMVPFLHLNIDAILDNDGLMDFNLKAAEPREADLEVQFWKTLKKQHKPQKCRIL